MNTHRLSIEIVKPTSSLIALLTVVLAFALYASVAQGQWTTNVNNINNTNSGNVGIGTSAPGSPLTVSAPSGIRQGVQITGAGNTWIFTELSLTPIGTIANGMPTNFAWSIRKDAFYGGDSSGPSMVMEIWRQNGGVYVPFIINPSGNVILAGANNATNGNVGIGTFSPAYKLDITGQLNTTGGLCISGDCKTAWSQVGGSQWGNSGSNIFFNSGNVGIGTTATPTRRLDVLGGNVFHQWSTTANSEYGFYTAINNNHFTSNAYFDGQWKMIASGKAAVVGPAPASGWAFSVSGDNTVRAANALSSFAQLFSVGMGGNVGVGTGTPDSLAKLHVYGSGGFGQDIQTTTNDWTRLRLVTPGRTWGFFLDGGTGGIGAGKFGLFDYTANLFRMIVDTTGKVGIGTTTPAKTLDVAGDINASGTIEGGNIKAKYQDVAEWVDSSQHLAPGTVVVVDSSKRNQVIAATQAYDSRVAGVISLQPGLSLGEEGEGRVLVAASGRVKVKVDATNGPILTGDLLVTSDRAGFAMKSVPVEIGGARIHRPGTLIGKALEPLARGTGEILVLLSLQ